MWTSAGPASDQATISTEAAKDRRRVIDDVDHSAAGAPVGASLPGSRKRHKSEVAIVGSTFDRTKWCGRAGGAVVEHQNLTLLGTADKHVQPSTIGQLQPVQVGVVPAPADSLARSASAIWGVRPLGDKPGSSTVPTT